jgi:hypothetical protein
MGSPSFVDRFGRSILASPDRGCILWAEGVGILPWQSAAHRRPADRAPDLWQTARDTPGKRRVKGLANGALNFRRSVRPARRITRRTPSLRAAQEVQQLLGDDFLAGLVLYTGARTLPFGDKLRALPVGALWQVG